MMVILMHLFALYIYKQILVGNGVKPENTKDFSQIFGVEGQQLFQITSDAGL